MANLTFFFIVAVHEWGVRGRGKACSTITTQQRKSPATDDAQSKCAIRTDTEYFLGSCVEQQKSRSFRGTLCLPPLIVLSYVKPSCALCSPPSSSSRASNKRRKASVRARSSSLRASCSLPPSSLWCADGYKYVQVRSCAARCFFPIHTSLHRHHPDLILCRKPSGIAIGRLCEKCDGRW